MIDINAIINTAINNAVDARIGEIQAAYANKMGEMAQAIDGIYNRLQSIEGVNRQLLSDSERADRILNSHADSLLGLDSLQVRLDSLENIAFDVNGNPRSRKSLDEDDVRGIVASLFEDEGEDLIEEAFTNLVEREDVITQDNLEEKVREVMENASITLSLS